MVATALVNLANRLVEAEETRDEAATLFQSALDIEERELGPNDPSLAITLSSFGGLYWRNKDFPEAEKLVARSVEILGKAHGEDSPQYATGLSNLSSIYSYWWQAVDDPVERKRLQGLEREAKEKSATVTRAARGTRHPETTARENNLAVMYANDGDFPRAVTHMVRAVAIYLSLDLLQHPDAQSRIAQLLVFWQRSGEADKAGRLRSGDGSDIFPIILEIEEEHRRWVAEDPDNRLFGPPSPYTGATE